MFRNINKTELKVFRKSSFLGFHFVRFNWKWNLLSSFLIYAAALLKIIFGCIFKICEADSCGTQYSDCVQCGRCDCWFHCVCANINVDIALGNFFIVELVYIYIYICMYIYIYIYIYRIIKKKLSKKLSASAYINLFT